MRLRALATHWVFTVCLSMHLLRQTVCLLRPSRGNSIFSRKVNVFTRLSHSTGVVSPTQTEGLAGSILGTKDLISARVLSALESSFDELKGQRIDSMVVATSKPEFGDYQCNVAMSLAKQLKKKPRDIAETLMAALEVGDMVDRLEVAGPGFINLFLSERYVQSSLALMAKDPIRLGIPPTAFPQTIVVDFSSPNIAKEMHVGHLRSTIIGDSISRILEFLGHKVVRLNHVGDWGTQFGMLIHYLKENYASALESGDDNSALDVNIGDLVTFYKAAKKRFDEDPSFQTASRNEVVKLQSGNADSLRAWRTICGISRVEFQKIYDLLNVTVEERGESFYNPYLPNVVSDFQSKGILKESEGAQCVFLPGYTNSDGSDMPLILQKSDGGFLYATTDLAAVRHRVQEEKADRVLYVTDIGQAQHFQMMFDAAHAVGYVEKEKVKLTHVPFGLVQVEAFL